MAKNNFSRIIVSSLSVLLLWAVISKIWYINSENHKSQGFVLPVGWDVIKFIDGPNVGAPAPITSNEGYPFAKIRPSPSGHSGLAEFNNVARYGNRFVSLFSAILLVAIGNGMYLVFRRRHD